MEHTDQENPGRPAASSSKKKGSGKKAQPKKSVPKPNRNQASVLRVIDANAAPHDANSGGPAAIPPGNTETKQSQTDTADLDESPRTPVKPRKATTTQKKETTDDTAKPPMEEVADSPFNTSSSELASTNQSSPPSTEASGILRPDTNGKESETIEKDEFKDQFKLPSDNVEEDKSQDQKESKDADAVKTKANGSGISDLMPQETAKKAQKPESEQESSYPSIYYDGLREARERDAANAYAAGGIRFAPWNIPYKRRLQTLAVLIHSLSIALSVSIFFFLCAIPLTWPILIPYLLIMLLSKAATDGGLRSRSDRFRRLPVWKFFAGYFPAKLHKTHDLPPTRKYIFGYHPHGIISHGAFAAFATEALGFSEKFPGITNSLLTLDSNFRIPLYRNYILSMGIQSVSKESIVNILTRGGPNNEGMGRAVTIVVGGARESLEAQPGIMHLVLGERKGFVKVAVRTGADLVPVLAFGENDLYDQVSPKTHPKLHKLQMFVLRTLKFTLPFLHGRGIFNYDVGLMPYRRPLNVVVGKPIKVQQILEGNAVPQAEIDRLHGLYVRELEKMWETYKDIFAPDRREEMQIVK
ncbi:diacylglycerol acyltransferase-domain-containing protein [Podospora didyma]|uniref:diacylglycerol O-acyltransferase n=1 Tax=Podospora didyma TaxID=330526 RepID=A0AAE0K9D2_9PEZI|nr:diacylglycerol acyltransferase-domain-containing protein [Podospora didyma]